jgi:hypothetical protein
MLLRTWTVCALHQKKIFEDKKDTKPKPGVDDMITKFAPRDEVKNGPQKL